MEGRRAADVPAAGDPGARAGVQPGHLAPMRKALEFDGFEVTTYTYPRPNRACSSAPTAWSRACWRSIRWITTRW
ncbi:hypothetical protein E6W36_11460 [Hankyongella ginsenosidimutans]|uniref:Uncharacterized protein n=1 Tax=Hankyongella ginsenosidimutans TaxID=1763828 RepID=A0A4D7C9Y5_9SPHN|nr:hypothetical protein [Hankyongella ginsenosidimutans]QCI79897.1 hypothetical protein E6W36_11460 [Hankyongella ginsenosidimutans]